MLPSPSAWVAAVPAWLDFVRRPAAARNDPAPPPRHRPPSPPLPSRIPASPFLPASCSPPDMSSILDIVSRILPRNALSSSLFQGRDRSSAASAAAAAPASSNVSGSHAGGRGSVLVPAPAAPEEVGAEPGARQRLPRFLGLGHPFAAKAVSARLRFPEDIRVFESHVITTFSQSFLRRIAFLFRMRASICC